MPHRGTETEFELTTIERLERLDYRYSHGEDLQRLREEVVLKETLRNELARRYPGLPLSSLDQAVARFSNPQGVDPLRRNMQFHADLTRGFDVKVERPGGRAEHHHVYALDWVAPANNDLLGVNQLSVRGQDDRRPDFVV